MKKMFPFVPFLYLPRYTLIENKGSDGIKTVCRTVKKKTRVTVRVGPVLSVECKVIYVTTEI